MSTKTYYMIHPVDDGPLQTDVRFMYRSLAEQAAKRYADNQGSPYYVLEVASVRTVHPKEDI
jgi:hypothetical protein